MRRLRVILFFTVLVASLAALTPFAHAQHGGGGHGGGMGPGGGMPGGMGPGFSPGGRGPGGMGAGDYGRDRGNGDPRRAPDSAGSVGGMRSRTQLGLLGRWWDDKHLAKDLKLRPDQKQHMDSIFETSRPALQKSFQDYQQEQGKLDAMYRSKALDETTLYSQIDKVSQTRAELGKVYTHYLLQIRAEMDTDQLQRLDDATKKQ